MVALTAVLAQLPAPAGTGAPGTGLPADAGVTPPGGEVDPLGTVGIALLAYGLVQLLSKVVDKLPVWKGAGDPHAAQPTPDFTADDRKRLERVVEQVMANHQRLERIQDQLTVQQRLIGEALDELREANGKLDNTLRKLRALWVRVGRRRKDRG